MANRLALLFLVAFVPSVFAAQLECKVEFVTQKAGGEDMEVETIAKKSQVIEAKKAVIEISKSEMKLDPKRKGYLETAATNIASAKAQLTQDVSGQDIISMSLSTLRDSAACATGAYGGGYGGYGYGGAYGRLAYPSTDEVAMTARVSTARSGDSFDLLADPVLAGNTRRSCGPTFKPGWIPRLRCTIN